MFKSKFSCLLIITFVVGFLSPGITLAESHGDKEMKDQHMSPEHHKMHDKMMEKWTKYATPGEKHKILQSMVGEWNYELKFWHTPESEPQISNGTTTIKSIMDGRFLKQKASAMIDDKPFEGMGIMGFNNEKQQFESVWIDNMGTGMMKGTGHYNSENNTIKEEGTYTCPQTNDDKSFTAITEFVDSNTFTYKLYTDDMNGKRYLAMEIVHKRIGN